MGTKFSEWETKAKLLGIYDDFKIKKEYIEEHKINSTNTGYKEIIILEEYIGSSKKVVIPPVDKIYSHCMIYNDSVEKLYLNSNTIYDMGFSCFEGCKKLREVEINAPIETLPIHSFCKCNKLEKIKLPNTLQSISASAFQNCRSLKTLELTNGLQYIMDLAFYNSGLESIIIPESVKYLGASVFRDCDKLETVVINSRELGITAMAKNSIIFDNVKTIIVRNNKVKKFVEKHLDKESSCRIVVQK